MLLRVPCTCCFPRRPGVHTGDLPPRHPGCSPGLPTSLSGASACYSHPSPSRDSPAWRSGGRTHWPRDVCTSRVMRVDVAGQMQFRASMAYLHSSSHTTWSAGRMVRGCHATADDPSVPHLRGRLLLTGPRRCQLRHAHRGAHQTHLPFPCPRLLPSLTPGSPVARPAWGPCLHLPSEKMERQLSPAAVLRAPEPMVLQPPTAALGDAHGPPICVPANFT